MIHRWKHVNKTLHLLGFLQGFGELLDGVVTIGSLGFLMSNFELSISRYRAKISIRQMKRIKAANIVFNEQKE